MISKSTILNYDDNDSFDDYDVEIIDYINSYHAFLWNVQLRPKQKNQLDLLIFWRVMDEMF